MLDLNWLEFAWACWAAYGAGYFGRMLYVRLGRKILSADSDA